jgi:predicted esterase
MSLPLDCIHRFVPGRSARTLLLLHGTGGTESDMLSLGRELDPEAALLSPRGKVSESGMPRFFRRLAEGAFDEEDLIRRTHELATFIREAATHYEIDSSKIVAVGYSNGANIAGALLLLRPGLLHAAALLRPMVPLVPETLPDLRRTAVLIAAGKQDPIVPPANTRALIALLERVNAQVTSHVENTGHGLTDATIENTRQWLGSIAR